MEELNNEMMVEEIDNDFEDDFEDEEFEDSNHASLAKIGLIGLGVAAAAGGIAVVGNKFVAPKLKAGVTKFKDWREERKEAKAEKKAKKEAEPDYIEVKAEVVEDDSK